VVELWLVNIAASAKIYVITRSSKFFIPAAFARNAQVSDTTANAMKY